MFSRAPLSLATLTLAVVVSACGSDSSVAPATQQRSDLNLAFAELSHPVLAASAAAFTGVFGTSPVIGVPSSCIFTATTGSFVCPTETINGLTISQSYALLTAAGTPQGVFDANTTAAVRTTTRVVGAIPDAVSPTEIDARQELTLSGLLTGNHTLNGTSTTKISGSLKQGSTLLPYTNTTSTTITNLVLHTSNSATNWPRSGTIVAESDHALTGLPSISSRVQVTFSGTSKVDVVVTVAGFEQRCNVDLVSHAPAC
jgi:hypothetical protein